jgi:hypothetical protein
VPRIGRVSGSVGQGLGLVSGRSSLQLVAVRWVNGSAVGADLLPVGAVGWWLVVPLLGRCLALALDLDRPKGSNRTPFG